MLLTTTTTILYYFIYCCAMCAVLLYALYYYTTITSSLRALSCPAISLMHCFRRRLDGIPIPWQTRPPSCILG